MQDVTQRSDALAFFSMRQRSSPASSGDQLINEASPYGFGVVVQKQPFSARLPICGFHQQRLAASYNIFYSGYMDIETATAALAALSQPTRLETFRLLVRHEPDGLPAGEIARQLDVPQNTMSAHLAVLTRAGLASAERHSRSIIYRAELNGLRTLMLYLVNDCCGGNAALCAPLIADLTTPRCPSPEGAPA